MKMVDSGWVIEAVNNGYVLTVVHKEGDEDILVFEDSGDKKHIQNLLYALLESLGELGSKHDSERVRVIRVNQDNKEIFD